MKGPQCGARALRFLPLLFLSLATTACLHGGDGASGPDDGASGRLNQADLAIKHFSLDEVALLTPGAVVDVHLALRNQGEGTAQGFQLSLYLTRNADGTNRRLWRHLVKQEDLELMAFAANTEDAEHSTIPSIVPADLVPGEWYAVLGVDTNDAVNESDEGNNVAVMGPYTVHTPPQLTSRSPGINGANVPRDATIEMVFDVPMDGASVTGDSVHLILAGYTATADVAYLADERKVVLQPQNMLVGGLTYTVVLTSGLRSEAGLSITPASWSFTTETDFYVIDDDTGVAGMAAAAARLKNGSLDGQVLIVGGAEIIAGAHPQLKPAPGEVYGDPNHARLFNPVGRTFENVAVPEFPRHMGATLTPLENGNALLAGGYLYYGAIDPPAKYLFPNAEIFDAATRQWHAAPSMSEPRIHHRTVSLADGRVLVTGGVSTNDSGQLLATRTSDLYAADGETVTAGPLMNTFRQRHTATVLPDGRVLIAGGENPADGVLASAELYDPATNQFVPLESVMATPRSNARAVLFNGQVLIIGGHGAQGQTLDTVDIFDPLSGTFLPSEHIMSLPREAFGLALMDDGRVLIVGGMAAEMDESSQLGDAIARSTSEIFDGAGFSYWDIPDLNGAQAYSPVISLGDKALVLSGGWSYTANNGDRALGSARSAVMFSPAASP